MSQPPPPPPYQSGQPYQGGQQPSGQPSDEQPYAPQGSQPHADQPYSGQPYAGQPQPGQAYPAQPDYQGYQYGGGPSRPNNTMALVSLIAGICGLTIVPFVGSVAAVITGHMARKQIAQTGEEGSGLATGGLIMGWIGVGLGLLAIVAMIAFFGIFAVGMGTAGSYS